MLRKTMLCLALALGFTATAAGTPAAAESGAVVLMYHRFGDDSHPSTNIRLDQFEAHLAEIAAGGYKVLPLPEIVAALREGRPLPERALAITIDDGSSSVWEEAWPRLKAAGLPFTLFVSTDEIDAGLPGRLTWDQIRTLQAAGVTIGSQGAAHLHMAGAAVGDIAADVERAARRIEQELGRRPEFFAWPYGEASAEAMRELRKHGVLAAFGQHSGVAASIGDPFYLPRFPLNEAYGDLARFRLVARARPLPVKDIVPADPLLRPGSNPPAFGFTLAGEVDADRLACFGSHEGRLKVERLGARIEVRAEAPFPPGRGRINCTAPAPGGGWRWFGYQYYVAGQ